MQSFVRHASRTIFDYVATNKVPRASQQLCSKTFRGAIYIQPLRSIAQRRHFVDGKNPQTSPKSSIPLGPPSSNPASQNETPGTSTDSIKPSALSTPPSNSSTPKHLSQEDHDEALPHNLPSSSESRRSLMSKRFSHLMENVQGNIFVASQRLNDLTGYSGIEALKKRITILEDNLAESQEAVRVGRQHYKQTIADRAASQREVNSLISRKESWTPTDVERFTSLYRSDHGNELSVQEAATKLADAERATEQAASKLSASILSRYHEEQIWSDKIRQMSTWGTWGLMGVNVLLFLVFQFGFEPWRRARLVRGFEDKVREALEREKERNVHKDHASSFLGKDSENLKLDAVVAAGIEELENQMDTTIENEDAVVDAIAVCIEDDASDAEGQPAVLIPEQEQEQERSFDWENPQEWKKAFLEFPHVVRKTILDLFSERTVSVTQQDVTIIALESAAMGAGLVAMVFMVLSGR